jgi:hypothetical protein
MWQQRTDERSLENALNALSAREQVGLLVRATRSLSKRERAEIWRVAGFSVLRDRFLPLLLHIVLKRVLVGALLWAISGVLIVVVLLVLAVVEQLNANAVGPVLVATISFLVGFLLFGLIDFVRALIAFFRTTSTRAWREELLTRLNACDNARRQALLRMMSTSLASKVPGESLLQSLVSACSFLVVEAMLIGLLLGISNIFPAIDDATWSLCIAAGSLVLGVLVPGGVQRYERQAHEKRA